jgi:hypothetical protein
MAQPIEGLRADQWSPRANRGLWSREIVRGRSFNGLVDGKVGRRLGVIERAYCGLETRAECLNIRQFDAIWDRTAPDCQRVIVRAGVLET